MANNNQMLINQLAGQPKRKAQPKPLFSQISIQSN